MHINRKIDRIMKVVSKILLSLRTIIIITNLADGSTKIYVEEKDAIKNSKVLCIIKFCLINFSQFTPENLYEGGVFYKLGAASIRVRHKLDGDVY